MKKTFLTSLVLLILLNVLIKPFYIFVIEPKIQITLGNIDFGFYFSLFGFSFILNIVLDLGITNFNNRNIARHPKLIHRFFGRMLAIKTSLGLVYLIIIVALGFIAKYNLQQLELLLVLVVNQFLTSMTLYFRSNISALHMFKTDGILSVLDKVLMIAVSSILLWGNVLHREYNIYHFVFSQTFSYLITFAISFGIVYRQIDKLKLQFDWNYYVIIIKRSLPFALLSFFMASYKYFDSFIIERILMNDLGKEQAGIYAQSFRLLDGISQYSYLFSIILLPMFSRMIRKNESVVSIAKLATSLLMVPIISLAIAIIFYRHQIILLLYEIDHGNSSDILGLLMVSLISISLTYIFGTLLTAKGNLRHLNIFAGTSFVINVILNVVLIPKYMAVGCAIAGVITQFLMASAQIVAAKRSFGITISPKGTTKFVVFVGSVILAGWLCKLSAIPWNLGFTITGATGITISFALKLLKWKDFLVLNPSVKLPNHSSKFND